MKQKIYRFNLWYCIVDLFVLIFLLFPISSIVLSYFFSSILGHPGTPNFISQPSAFEALMETMLPSVALISYLWFVFYVLRDLKREIMMHPKFQKGLDAKKQG